VLLSIVVGIVMSALGITLDNFFYQLDRLIRGLYDLGFAWVEWLFRYFLIGAVVVVPIWIIARLFGAFGKRSDDRRV
jgi:hypothetical protein